MPQTYFPSLVNDGFENTELPLHSWNRNSFSYLSCSTTKPTQWHVHPAKTQISHAHPRSLTEFLPCAQWVTEVPMFLHVDSEDSDQTGWIPRLIWVFAGRTGHFVGFVMLWLIYEIYKHLRTDFTCLQKGAIHVQIIGALQTVLTINAIYTLYTLACTCILIG